MEKRIKLFDTVLGDTVFQYNDAIVVQFNGTRNVASTSTLNGGVRSDLKFVFNKSCANEPRVVLKEDAKCTYEDYFAQITSNLELDNRACTGMGTAALVENMSVVTLVHNQLSVTAMVTAGIDINGGRAGDLAQYDELAQQHINPMSGTINIFLMINAQMPDGALNRAIVTATEAKCVALQELMANSMYSTGLATGSGTDTIIVVGNLESPIFLENAGKHCKLGELIGQSVIKAVKEALDKQTGMNAVRQASVIWQNKRYGITADNIWTLYNHIYGDKAKPRNLFDVSLNEVDSDLKAVAYVASCIHLIDQFSWQLLNDEIAREVCNMHLNAFRAAYGLPDAESYIVDNHCDIPVCGLSKEIVFQLITIMAQLCHR
jgi:adenosylcobinamide amidohydrolase